MNAAENPQIEVLFNASARDERTLQFDVDDEVFGFHTQQAIEKLLKALITARGQEYPLTHDLRTLERQLETLSERLPSLSFSAEDLHEYSVGARYDKGEALSVAQRADLRA